MGLQDLQASREIFPVFQSRGVSTYISHVIKMLFFVVVVVFFVVFFQILFYFLLTYSNKSVSFTTSIRHLNLSRSVIGFQRIFFFFSARRKYFLQGIINYISRRNY